ncbi:MAG: tetratricopeptide repeat protein [Bryobacteraceae bacterium]
MQTGTGTLATGVDPGVDEQVLRTHLAHVVSSSQFSGAPKLANFLRFVVDTALAGQGDQIKESLIAVEVYGRRPDYNPQIDSTVRVEAGRLRARLRQYYESAGAGQPVEIELPKGKYVPQFRARSISINKLGINSLEACGPQIPEPNPAHRRGSPVRARHVLALLAILMVTAAAFGLLRNDEAGAGPAAPIDSTVIEVAARSASEDAAGGASISRRKTAADAKTMEMYLRAFELLRIPVLKYGVVPAVPATVFESVRLFEEVTRRNPNFASGWVGLAEANEWLYEIDKHHPPERLIAAKAAALRAIDLDANLPEAWTILASLLFFREWNIPAAEEASRRAIELNPRDIQVRQRFIDLLRVQGRLDEAARQVALAASIQPSAPDLRNGKALLLLDAGRSDEAIEEAMTAEGLNPSRRQMAYTRSLWIQGAAHQREGRLKEAEALYRKAMNAQPHDRWSEPSLGHLLAASGRTGEAIEIRKELHRQLALGRPRQYALALVSIGLGRHEDAVAWLERGFIDRDCAVLFTPLDWRFAPLSSNSRFQALLARIRQTSTPRTAYALLNKFPPSGL